MLGDEAARLAAEVLPGAVAEVLAARRVTRGGGDLRACRLALPRDLVLDGLDTTVARAFELSLTRLSAAGARIDTIARQMARSGVTGRCPLPGLKHFMVRPRSMLNLV